MASNVFRYHKERSRGSVFLLAMVALVTLLLLGTSLVQTAIQGLASASNDRRQAEAFGLAESGVDMAITKLYEDYDSINDTLATAGYYSDGFSMPNGTVSYTVTAPYSGIADSCLIVSDATTWANKTAEIRVIAAYQADVSRIFDMAIFSDSPLTLNGAGGVYPDENGDGGEIYSNGDITFNGTSFEMTADGSLYTTGTVNWVPTDVPATHVHQGVAPVNMPVIDLDYYQSIATTTYNGNVTFNSSNMTGLSGVIYVKGNVSISGNYTGQAVIVATGKIQVTGNVTASNPDDDTLVIMSPKSIKIAGDTHIDGLIYAHSVVDDGTTTTSGNVEINGAIIADVVRTNGSITITYDDVWKSLPLPGVGKTQWAPVSWQVLYL
jgi:cytoskeletal protein CcmA (bactofilin family)